MWNIRVITRYNLVTRNCDLIKELVADSRRKAVNCAEEISHKESDGSIEIDYEAETIYVYVEK